MSILSDKYHANKINIVKATKIVKEMCDYVASDN